jgi:hypothetical protein
MCWRPPAGSSRRFGNVFLFLFIGFFVAVIVAMIVAMIVLAVWDPDLFPNGL